MISKQAADIFTTWNTDNQLSSDKKKQVCDYCLPSHLLQPQQSLTASKNEKEFFISYNSHCVCFGVVFFYAGKPPMLTSGFKFSFTYLGRRPPENNKTTATSTLAREKQFPRHAIAYDRSQVYSFMFILLPYRLVQDC